MGKKPDITITSDYLNYVRNQIQKAITTLCQKEYLDEEDVVALLQMTEALQSLGQKLLSDVLFNVLINELNSTVR